MEARKTGAGAPGEPRELRVEESEAAKQGGRAGREYGGVLGRVGRAWSGTGQQRTEEERRRTRCRCRCARRSDCRAAAVGSREWPSVGGSTVGR